MNEKSPDTFSDQLKILHNILIILHPTRRLDSISSLCSVNESLFFSWREQRNQAHQVMACDTLKTNEDKHVAQKNAGNHL